MPIHQRLRLPVRKIQSKPPTQAAKTAATVTVEQSHARQISELPADQLEVVVDAIREGINNHSIAHYFGEQGWLRVTEKTFVQYITAFKRICPHMINEAEPATVANVTDLKRSANLSGIVSKRKPAMDEEKELEQLIRVQSVRLRRGVEFELQTGMVNHNLHKDVLASGTLLETLAKVRGKLAGAGRPTTGNGHVSNEAQEQLRRVDTSEAVQDRLVNLVAGLVPLVKAQKADEQTINT